MNHTFHCAAAGSAALATAAPLHMLPDFLRRTIELDMPGQPLRVLHLGGAMSAGTGCLDTVDEWSRGFRTARECSWSSRVAQIGRADV